MLEVLACKCPCCGVPYVVYCDCLVINHTDTCTHKDTDLKSHEDTDDYPFYGSCRLHVEINS